MKTIAGLNRFNNANFVEKYWTGEIHLFIITHYHLFMILFIYPGVLSADYCYDSYNDETYYCEYGCCDDENDELDKHCCTIAGIIVGACIGGLVLISLIVVAICCCMKHKGQSGHVIGTTTTTSIVAVGGTTSM